MGILADLSGPKIRIESFVNGKVHAGGRPAFRAGTSLDADAGNEREVGCAYKDLIKDVKAGDFLLLADGYIMLEVLSVNGTGSNASPGPVANCPIARALTGRAAASRPRR